MMLDEIDFVRYQFSTLGNPQWNRSDNPSFWWVNSSFRQLQYHGSLIPCYSYFALALSFSLQYIASAYESGWCRTRWALQVVPHPVQVCSGNLRRHRETRSSSSTMMWVVRGQCIRRVLVALDTDSIHSLVFHFQQVLHSPLFSRTHHLIAKCTYPTVYPCMKLDEFSIRYY